MTTGTCFIFVLAGIKVEYPVRHFSMAQPGVLSMSNEVFPQFCCHWLGNRDREGTVSSVEAVA